MELLHQIFPRRHIYLDVFLLGIGLYVYLRITKKINTKLIPILLLSLIIPSISKIKDGVNIAVN